MTEKTKKLEAEPFQVRAQLERASSAKLDEMLSIQKSASDRTGLGYDFSSSNIASTSATIFVPPSNNVEIENNNVKIDSASENLDKSKSILEAPPKLEKKKWKIRKIQKQCVLCTLVLVYLGWPLKKSCLNCVSLIA